MNYQDKILVLGATGLVGSAIVRELKRLGYENLLTPTRQELDLYNELFVKSYFVYNKPDYVFLCAADVGGIKYNVNNSGSILYNNLRIQNNVIHNSYENNVKKLLFLGSSCCYPAGIDRAIVETDLLTGPLEPTNEGYALAKIAGIKLLQNYKKQYGFNSVSVMPNNITGPNDKFDPENGHLVGSLIYNFVNANINNLPFVECWGDGSAKREIVYSDDVANACVFLMNNYEENEIVNIGTNWDYCIRDIVRNVKILTGYEGKVVWKDNGLVGMKRKLLKSNKLFDLGWRPKYNLYTSIEKTVDWYLKHKIN